MLLYLGDIATGEFATSSAVPNASPITEVAHHPASTAAESDTIEPTQRRSVRPFAKRLRVRKNDSVPEFIRQIIASQENYYEEPEVRRNYEAF